MTKKPDKKIRENRMRNLLREMRDYLVDREDVRDGSDGTPRPNDAMSMLSEFGDRIEEALRV